MAEYIDRDRVIQEISEWCVRLNNPKDLSKEDTLYILESIPAEDVKPVVKGEWKWNKFWDYFYCSECGNNVCGSTLEVLDGSYKFCPYCGAKMREGNR